MRLFLKVFIKSWKYYKTWNVLIIGLSQNVGKYRKVSWTWPLPPAESRRKRQEINYDWGLSQEFTKRGYNKKLNPY
jgi:hypothetical protein